ncbi:hypothetical protein ACFV2Z_26945 [Streptomyces sp. NPDC059688]|uniref:hypothetical protein n=1 Tax=Streptomyces sp. NPDC059688 TaxID=3346906 RepID=UPI003684F3B7
MRLLVQGSAGHPPIVAARSHGRILGFPRAATSSIHPHRTRTAIAAAGRRRTGTWLSSGRYAAKAGTCQNRSVSRATFRDRPCEDGESESGQGDAATDRSGVEQDAGAFAKVFAG